VRDHVGRLHPAAHRAARARRRRCLPLPRALAGRSRGRGPRSVRDLRAQGRHPFRDAPGRELGGPDGVDEATREAYTRIYAEGHDPGDANGIAVALRNHGRSLADTGRTEEARARFLQSIAIDPGWYQPHEDLGIWHARVQ
jgi:hypothetical protein